MPNFVCQICVPSCRVGLKTLTQHARLWDNNQFLVAVVTTIYTFVRINWITASLVTFFGWTILRGTGWPILSFIVSSPCRSIFNENFKFWGHFLKFCIIMCRPKEIIENLWNTSNLINKWLWIIPGLRENGWKMQFTSIDTEFLSLQRIENCAWICLGKSFKQGFSDKIGRLVVHNIVLAIITPDYRWFN